jgi:hypothetical protein
VFKKTELMTLRQEDVAIDEKLGRLMCHTQAQSYYRTKKKRPITMLSAQEFAAA